MFNKYIIGASVIAFLLMTTSIVILYNMNTNKAQQIAILNVENNSLKLSIKQKDDELVLNENLLKFKEDELTKNREIIKSSNEKIKQIENELSKHKEANDKASDIFQEYFRKKIK